MKKPVILLGAVAMFVAGLWLVNSGAHADTGTPPTATADQFTENGTLKLRDGTTAQLVHVENLTGWLKSSTHPPVAKKSDISPTDRIALTQKSEHVCIMDKGKPVFVAIEDKDQIDVTKFDDVHACYVLIVVDKAAKEKPAPAPAIQSNGKDVTSLTGEASKVGDDTKTMLTRLGTGTGKTDSH